MARIKKIITFFTFAIMFSFFTNTLYGQPFGFTSSRTERIKEHNILYSKCGRFVFGQISESSKDQFMLDTYTGRLWRISETGEVGIFLTPVPYKIKEGEYQPLPPPVKRHDTGKRSQKSR